VKNSFDQDLELGERAERFVIEQLKKEMPTLKKIKGYNPDFDLTDINGHTIEVKLDVKSQETGNIGIEYRHRGKPSAISTSKASEWIIIYFRNKWKYIRVNTGDLRAYIKSNWEYLHKIKGEGDKSSLVLIPVVDMEEAFVFKIIEV